MLLFLATPWSAATPAPFEGMITAALTRAGGEQSHLLFITDGKLLRIEDVADKVTPVNIVDFALDRLTIVYADNRSYIVADLTKEQGAPSEPALSPAFPTPPPVPTGTDRSNDVPGPTAPSPPGFPSPPAMPELPDQRERPRVPRMPILAPPMPALSGMLPALELKKTEKTRKILGLECTLYQVTDRGQTFDVWAMNDSSLFPFQMLERRSHRLRFGQPTIEEQWPELLRKEALFPLEATLGNEAGKQDRLSFKIEKIEKREINDRKLFEPPEGYQQLQPAQFR